MPTSMQSRIRIITTLICLTAFVVGARGDTFTVTNTTDQGAGSLRGAIEDANANLGPDRIEFAIPFEDGGYNPPNGVWGIQPQSQLPSLTDDGTVIDGTTQAAFIGEDVNSLGPEIVLNGVFAGEATGLSIESAENEVRALVINQFAWFGISIAGEGADNNVIAGNYVGSDASGRFDLGNGFSGILVYTGADHNTIGGPDPADANVVSGNNWSGVEIQGLGADWNLVVGNFIGTDRTGVQDLGNAHQGVDIWSSARRNTIGGATTNLRNIIASNEWGGVSIGPANSTRNAVIGNHIGVGAAGIAPIPSQNVGISCGADSTIIGGTNSGEGNVIGGSLGEGIIIVVATGCLVAGNSIGTDASGEEDLGNLTNGIRVLLDAHDLVIGPGNTIANNGFAGIEVNGTNSTGVTLTENSIFDNGGLGINNAEGGNAELTPPTIAAAGFGGVAGTTVADATVEIFSDDGDEGRIYEGSVLSDGDGNYTWIGNAFGPGVTATVTDAGGNTSEFSNAATVVGVDDQLADAALQLRPNYPNPFNPSTRIDYSLRQEGHLVLRVLDLSGRVVRTLIDRPEPAGDGSVTWDGLNEAGEGVASGSYLAEIRNGREVRVAKMTMVR